MKQMLLGWAFFLLFLPTQARVITDGGDHAGNGGFTDVKGKKLLKIATTDLIKNVNNSTYDLFIIHPEYRDILLDVLVYENLLLKQNDTRQRNGRRLMMDYELNPNAIVVLYDFFLSFAATNDDHLLSAAKEVKLRLLHEASHIWGYNEEEASFFSKDYLEFIDTPVYEARPNGFDFSNSCLCQNKKEVLSTLSKNSCKDVCFNATKEELSLLALAGLPVDDDSVIQNLYEWCFDEIPGGATGPDCNIELIINNHKVESLRPHFIDNNFIQFPLNRYGIKPGDKVDWSIVSLSLTSDSRSLTQSFEILFDDSSFDKPKLTKVKQYSCFEYGDLDFGEDSLVKLFYYYPETTYPEAIPFDLRDNVFCHDQQTYGRADSVLYPRLELRDAFSVWSLSDPLMRDRDIDGRLDINNLIGDRTNTTIDLFKFMTFKSIPHGSPKKLGIYMSSFVNEEGRSFCPKFRTDSRYQKENVAGASQILDVIKKIVQIDTEPIFLAEPQDVYPRDGWINVSLSQVSGALFTVDRGQITLVNDKNRHHKALFFYWPIDQDSPLIKKSYQTLYRIKQNTYIDTTDKSYGCIPVSGDVIQDPVFDDMFDVGERCSSDYQCSSLCCNGGGFCSAHDPEGSGVTCSKPPGLSCVSDEFCQKENVTQCFIVNIGVNSRGAKTCSLRCYSLPMLGSCESFSCVPPEAPPAPDFDPSNPDCSSAIDPPTRF